MPANNLGMDLLPSEEDSSASPEAIKGRVIPQKAHWPLWKLFLLALPQLGVQILWVFLGPNASIYMMNLGMPKTLAILNNIAGPITGFFTGPMAGAYSDNCTLRLGRRRPVILFGLASFAIASTIFAGAEHVFGRENGWAILIAAPMYWVLDVTINILQTPHRALVADFASEEQQLTAQVFFTLIGAIGNVVGFRLMTLWAKPVDHVAEILFGVFVVNAVLVGIQFVVGKEVPLPKDQAKGTKGCLAPLVEVSQAATTSPPIVHHLAFVHVMLWVTLTVWNLYGGQWFDFCVFDGNVTAPEGSYGREQYELGNSAFSNSGQMKAAFQFFATLFIMFVLAKATIKSKNVYWPLLLIGGVVCFIAAFLVGNDGMLGEVMMVLAAAPEIGCWTVPYGIIAVINKRAEKEGKGVSTALQMALLNCCITLGQQITTMTLSGFTLYMPLAESLTALMAVGGVSCTIAAISAFFIKEGEAEDESSSASSDNDDSTDDSAEE